MEFQITREELQNINQYKDSKKQEHENKSRIAYFKQLIKTEIWDKIIQQNNSEKKFVWKNLIALLKMKCSNVNHYFDEYGNCPQFQSRVEDNKLILTSRNGNCKKVAASTNIFPFNNDINQEVINIQNKIKEYLPEFINLLEETFIGCEFYVDPLQTYIIIDWS